MESGVPYVIENVPEAPLVEPVVLCGSAFFLTTVTGLRLRRHRAFETNWPLTAPPCDHDPASPIISVTGHSGRAGRNGTGTALERRQAMGIPWLSADPLAEAIPPAYTEYIGRELLKVLDA